MRVQLGSVLVASAVTAGLFAGTASAQNIDWATCATTMPACSSMVTGCCTESAAALNFGSGTSGSPSINKAIVIPMDRCHQALSTPTTMAPPGAGAPMWCRDSPAGTSNGMMFAYGLIYRLMQVGVPVYWAVNPTKHASGPMAIGAASDHTYVEDDIDMWILHSSQTRANIPTGVGALNACTSSCVGPVSLLDDNLAVASTYQYKEFPLRGSVFLIAGTDTDADGIADRTEFNSFWQNYGDGSPASGVKCGISNTDCYDFTQVAMYEVNSTAIPAWKNYITSTAYDGIPLAVKLNYKPPRIARTDSSGDTSNGFLLEANLKDTATAACTQGVFVHSSGTWPYDPVVCDVTEPEMLNGALVTGAFGWAWFDGSSFASCSKALQAIRTFITGVPGVTTPGNVMVNDSTIEDIEECANHQLLGRFGAAYSSSTGALDLITTAFNEQGDQPFTIPYPTNLFAQYGDLPMDFASSSASSWKTGNMSSSSSWGYNTRYATPATSSLKRLITREASSATICGDINGDGDVATASGTIDPTDKPHYFDVFPHASATACYTVADSQDGAAYGRFENSASNGIVFYLPGNQFSNNGARGQLRLLLNSLIATPTGVVTPPSLTSYEVSRATPIVPLINGLEYIVQGTYVPQASTVNVPVINGDTDVANWYFPFRVGHMRARLASAPTTVLLDAGCNSTIAGFSCPAGSSGIPSTRKIFTNTTGGDLRGTANVYLDTLNLATPSTAAEIAVRNSLKDGLNLSNTTIATMRNRIYAGYPNGSGGYIAALGGVDRSTVAVIQASEVASGGTARPMMSYFGAADGMMHAVCMETNVAYGCTDEGHELWAFMPRKQLPLVRTNTQRIDGSARVLDAYIDPDGAGTTYQTSWRTILVFQTGTGDYTGPVGAGREPAVYALDVTVPANPMLLWEYTDSSASTFSLGQGLTTSAGPVTIAGVTKYLTWVDTSNLGTSGPGTVVTAINLETGAKHRQVLFSYSPNPRVASNDRVVSTGIPGGTVPLDLPAGTSSKVTNIMVNDIYGRLWLLNPDTLVSVNGATTPMFTQSADYYAMGPKPAVYSQGGNQYAVFTTGFYHDPTNTTWPLACCKSNTAGTACDATQPATPITCSQYNNSTFQFPRQMAVAVKVDTTPGTTHTIPAADCDTDPSATAPACTNTAFLFRRSLARDERGTSQALVVGTDIFLTTESDNVNRSGYGTTGSATGNLYQLGSATGTFAGAPTAVMLGAGAPAASNITGGARAVYAGVGTFTSGSTTTTGSNVASKSTTGVDRKVWLRTE